MKAYTNIEQSKKLAEILPIESADMWYSCFIDVISDTEEYDKEPMSHKPICNPEKAIAAWSLTALLNAIPTKYHPVLTRGSDFPVGSNDWFIYLEEDESASMTYADEPIDACVEMIVKLKENKNKMNYEQKYKDALEKIKELLKDQEIALHAREKLAKVFPELKESEDERIREAIHIYLDWLDGRNKEYQPKGEYTIKDMIAWLEKQGEQKVSYTTLVETGNGGINALITKELPTNDCKDEQKPTDKVEPKFRVFWLR